MAALDRVAFSPGEFAALFGKSQTWGYRQIYAGKVKAITEYGRLSIPAVEVERILQTAGVYDGLKAKDSAKTKEDYQRLKPTTLQSAWQSFLHARKAGAAGAALRCDGQNLRRKKPPRSSNQRRAALARLTRRGMSG